MLIDFLAILAIILTVVFYSNNNKTVSIITKTVCIIGVILLILNSGISILQASNLRSIVLASNDLTDPVGFSQSLAQTDYMGKKIIFMAIFSFLIEGSVFIACYMFTHRKIKKLLQNEIHENQKTN